MNLLAIQEIIVYRSQLEKAQNDALMVTTPLLQPKTNAKDAHGYGSEKRGEVGLGAYRQWQVGDRTHVKTGFGLGKIPVSKGHKPIFQKKGMSVIPSQGGFSVVMGKTLRDVSYGEFPTLDKAKQHIEKYTADFKDNDAH